MTICSKCGEVNDDDDKFCGRCAATLPPKPQDQTQPQDQPHQLQSQAPSQNYPQAPQVNTQVQMRHKRGFSRLIPGLVVAGLAIVLLVVGIVIIGGNKTIKVPSAVDVDAALASAKTSFDANNGTSASAPQQSVVNGWYANDLLVITAQAVNTSNNTARAIAASQQKVLDSNRTLSLILVVSVGGLLLAFGAFFILKDVLE